MKKIISIILTLALLCLSLASCSRDGAPDGMKSATVSGEPFVLYVPESFADNTSSGISSAYITSLEGDLTVTARYYTPASETSLDEYMNACADSYALRLDGFEKLAEIAGDTLGGADARRLEYKMTENGKEYTVIQRSVAHGGDFVSLTIYSTGDALSVYGDYATQIVENFMLCEKALDAVTPLVDKKTPAGMQIASSDIVEYRLYVPMSWECDPNSGVSEARVAETGTNVTVTSYSPSAEERGMTLSQYMQKCIAEYRETISGFPELVTVTDGLMVAEKEADGIEFSAEYDGVVYKLRQVMFYAPEFDLYYTFTYTAIADNYELHMADFDAMIGAFCFR